MLLGMNITKIYLKGYKPLALNSIEEITIDINNDLTLILGSNGSGKSSLLREMNPHPASCTDYRDEGIKHIYLTHNGSEYELISYLRKGGRHTFIKDGVELLSMVTATLQRELVISEFNYSLIVHKLLIGDLKFTSMSPAARREILTTISPLDLRYALKLYGSVKEGARDGQAILKHLSAKNADAKVKLRELNIPEDADSKREHIENCLNRLIPYTHAKHPELNTVLTNIDLEFVKLNQIKTRLERFETERVPTAEITNLDDLTDYINGCSGKIVATQININNLTTEVESLTGITNSIVDNSLSVDDLQARIAHITAELQNYQTTFFVNSNFSNYLATLIDLTAAFERLFEESAELQYFTVEQRAEINTAYQHLTQQAFVIHTKTTAATSKVIHLSDAKVVANCPKCKFEFDMRGDNIAATLAHLQGELTLLGSQERSLEKKLATVNEQRSHVNNLTLLINELQNIKRTLPMPIEFWDALGSCEHILQYPAQVRNTIINWQVNIEHNAHSCQLQNELVQYTNALNIFVKYGSDVDTKLITLQDAIVAELLNKRILEKQCAYAKTLHRNVLGYTGLADQAQSLLATISNQFKLATTVAIQDNAKANCKLLYNKLADSTQLLNQRNSLIASISEMDTEFTTLLAEQKALILLEEHLSPNKGLIADQMLGFIGSYIDQINIICNELWEYPLNIGLCNMDNGVLNYAFPLIVVDELVPDINDGSTGQVDVINIAFTMVMRQYLQLNDYPLFLDESGASFDELHRTKLMAYVKMLTSTKQASQIFMINHYANVHNGLVNHDVVVLDARNITVPNVYNEHVVITHKD